MLSLSFYDSASFYAILIWILNFVNILRIIYFKWILSRVHWLTVRYDPKSKSMSTWHFGLIRENASPDLFLATTIWIFLFCSFNFIKLVCNRNCFERKPFIFKKRRSIHFGNTHMRHFICLCNLRYCFKGISLAERCAKI